eukprot:jgi/Hompol1/6778/HPOL_000934-RA
MAEENTFDEEDGMPENPIATFQTLSAEGDLLLQKGSFHEAIDVYTRALLLRPQDKHCLVCRSRCYIQIGSPVKALADADRSLADDPTYFKGLYLKAEALYAQGDFELALMYYHRGNKLRPELNEFRTGIQKAREAIDNSIGNPKTMRIRVPQKLRRNLAALVAAQTAASETSPGAGGKTGGAQQQQQQPPGPPGMTRGSLNPGQTEGGAAGGSYDHFATHLTPSMENKLLGELYEDKLYLQELLSDRDFVDYPDERVLTLVSEGLRYLNTRIEFWRQQNPLYSRKPISLQNGTKWPKLLINATANEAQPPSVVEIVRFLRIWFRRAGCDIVKWPESLPRPPDDSPLFRAGQFGLDVVSNLVGHRLAEKIEDVGWNVLGKFANVTIFAKAKTKEALEHPLARPFLPFVPEQIRSLFLSSAEAEALINEFDSAGHFLQQFAAELQKQLQRSSHRRSSMKTPESAPDYIETDQTRAFESVRGSYKTHFNGRPLTEEEMRSWVVKSNGSLVDFKEQFHARIFSGGVEPSLRPDAWRYLLKVHPFDSTSDERVLMAISRKTQYESLRLMWEDVVAAAQTVAEEGEDPDAEKPERPSGGPVGDEDENADPLSKVNERKYRIEKDVVRTDQNVEFFSNMSKATHTMAGLEVGDNVRVLRDVLMTYTVFNFDLGYVQGMSDLAAPILEVMNDEVEGFWSFVGFMETMRTHFSRDQIGMKTELHRLELLIKLVDPPLYRHLERTDSSNMFCCFRWLLILFKREFPFEDIKTLWEVIWACPLTDHFHLFIALAILNMQRQQLFQQRAFDEILKYTNNMMSDVTVPDAIQRAQVMFYLARDLFVQFGPTTLTTELREIPDLASLLGENVPQDPERAVSPDNTTALEVWQSDVEGISLDEWHDLAQLFV